MPRDLAVDQSAVLRLPGQRTARVCPADDAGETRLVLLDGTPLDKAYAIGWLDRDQREAGRMVASLFEATGLRQHLGVQFDGVFTNNTAPAESRFERMGRTETAAWRQLHRLLAKAPLCTRGEVEAVCISQLAPVSVARLRTGLSAIARAMGLRR